MMLVFFPMLVFAIKSPDKCSRIEKYLKKDAVEI